MKTSVTLDESVPKQRVLLVCLGNICRSPTAEAVLRHKLVQAGLAAMHATELNPGEEEELAARYGHK